MCNQYTLYTPTHRYVIFIFRCHNSLHLNFIYNDPGIKKFNKTHSFYLSYTTRFDSIPVRTIKRPAQREKCHGRTKKTLRQRQKKPSTFFFYVSRRITRQGLPTANESSGISCVTTLPAPITQRSPIVTPGQITVLPPIQQSAPTVTG